ncbi:TPA: hypothetical protein HA278_01375 [Candidatus Woesearchaeota archaeon]|jgi:hypothetical protein|nr:hypothetical protein [archaeon]HIJ10684.1 hypothetical protein [Candidatus Woesearchaeota archaeon]|tara:strand:- start:2053 stop:2745 length:693 start_codon:yes stop_codon:yes gene_type:complete
MGLKASQLLLRTAFLLEEQKKVFSRKEITKKINEIKYLAKQKKVPRLTLQKKIVHLEQQLKQVYELEKRLLREKKKENIKIGALKRQIKALHKRLEMSESPHFHKKVEKLSHLLGDQMARKETEKQVRAKTIIPPTVSGLSKPDLLARVEKLKLLVEKVRKEDPKHAELILARIQLIESKLQGAASTPLATGKHTMMMKSSGLGSKTFADLKIQKELPVPPPPKRVIGTK